MTTEQDLFPRGGRKQTRPENGEKRKHDDNLFPNQKASKTKKPRIDKSLTRPVLDDNSFQKALKLNGTLTYKKLKDGLEVLACVRQISNLSVQIEFPGIIYGHITINHISDAFTSYLTEQLQGNGSDEVLSVDDLLEVGQLIPTKILSIGSNDKGYDVQASTNPADVNSGKVHSSFKKGALVWGNIIEELDHGYQMTLGVKNCRVFLPYKNVDDSVKYNIGQPLFCIIHKADTSPSVTNITVSAKKEHIAKFDPEDDLSLSDVLPGMKVKFFVEELAANGLKGYYLNNCFAYIDKTQFCAKPRKIREGSLLTAYVLYVEPITKVTYLTLRELQVLSPPTYDLNKKLKCEIQTYVSNGVIVKLGDSETGFITNKRLLNTVQVGMDADATQIIKNKYPEGSKHQCRILDFNYMQQLYICTVEKSLVNEAKFSAHDFHLGEKVNVKIDEVVPKGLIVACGHVKGFVPNLHISNSFFTQNIKGKFHEGLMVPARVLNRNEGKIVFTLKQGFVQSDNCLVDYKNVKINAEFVGCIMRTTRQGAAVAFYGNVTGWLAAKDLNEGITDSLLNPEEYFFIGQTLNVFIKKINGEKLILSLRSIPVEEVPEKIKIGSVVDAVVTSVEKSRLLVKAGPRAIEAVVPVAHLAKTIELANLWKDSYFIGARLENLMCIRHDEKSVLSHREFAGHQEFNLRIRKFQNLKPDMELRCSFLNKTPHGIYISTPILNYHRQIFIPKQHVRGHRKFTPEQLLLGIVLNVDLSTKSLRLKVDGEEKNQELSLEDIVDELAEKVAAFADITRYRVDQKILGYEIGSKVQCTVSRITKDTYFVTLPNGCEGMVPSHLANRSLEVGSSMEGLVLDYDLRRNSAYISFKTDVNNKVNKIQDGVIQKSLNSSCIIDVLLHTASYTIGVLRDGPCNRQLVYLPLNYTKDLLHEKKLKVILLKKAAHRIIAIPKKVKISLARQERKRSAKAPKSIENKKPKLVNTQVEENRDEVDEDSTHEAEEHNENKENCPAGALSGIASFYHEPEPEEEVSSEEDDDEDETTPKRKLTPAERVELGKKEEQRIARIEKELAELSNAPQTSEQFERVLLTNPNSSELWIKYISMLVATTEVDKARRVGKQALETIDMSLADEKVNVWIALLKLENMYGTKDSFEELFTEAVKFNDSLVIYLNVIKMLGSSGKVTEMEEKIRKVRMKEKQNSKMWLEIAQVYYSLGQFRNARNFKDAALKVIEDRKRQFDLIVKFGLMECQMGEFEEGVLNFEAILNTYPQKVTIWIVYVDQLVKRGKIQEARKVLERAGAQKLPVKNMKTIYQKFIHFEEQFGTPERVEAVREKAKDYVKLYLTRT